MLLEIPEVQNVKGYATQQPSSRASLDSHSPNLRSSRAPFPSAREATRSNPEGPGAQYSRSLALTIPGMVFETGVLKY